MVTQISGFLLFEQISGPKQVTLPRSATPRCLPDTDTWLDNGVSGVDTCLHELLFLDT